MLRGFLAPLTELLEFYLSLDELLVFSRPVINPFAGGTGYFYKLFLWHFIVC